MIDEKEMVLVCEKCGKKLIHRLPNGLFHFIFGKKKDQDGTLLPYSPVEIYIHGSIKMRCISRECGHYNVFTYFPPDITQLQADQPQSIKIEKNKLK
jgi:hypothetical protein